MREPGTVRRSAFRDTKKTPPPNPLPYKERGRRRDAVLPAPPLLVGEGVGGRGFLRVFTVHRSRAGSIVARGSLRSRGERRCAPKNGNGLVPAVLPPSVLVKYALRVAHAGWERDSARGSRR